MSPNQHHQPAKKTVEGELTSLVNELDFSVDDLTKRLDREIEPVRHSVFKRYPVIFTLLATFGVAATFFALEQILAQYDVLNRYPWLILLIGVITLALTGTLYKN